LCFSTISFDEKDRKFRSTKGCMAEQECKAREREWNGGHCGLGVVTNNCTYCCDEENSCNYDRYQYTATPPSACGGPGYQHCLQQFTDLVTSTSLDPDLLFSQFCRSVPEMYRCIAESVTGCCDDNWHDINSTLQSIFADMIARCPVSCDEQAGYNCSHVYYRRNVDLLTQDYDKYCSGYLKIELEQDRCRLKETGSCDGTVRDGLNASFRAIEWSALHLCPLPPLPNASYPTVSPQCDEEAALTCITEAGQEIIDYFHHDRDVRTLCGQVKDKRNCYLVKSEKCPDDRKRRLEAAWNFTDTLLAGRCVEAERPICDTAHARSCVLMLWGLVNEVQDFAAACKLLEETVQCVEEYLAGCTDLERVSVHNLLEIVKEQISNKCDRVFEILATNKTLEVTEGGPSVKFNYRFLQPPSSMCRSGENNCKIFVEIDIEIGTKKEYPKCPDVGKVSGKIIAQAVLEGDPDDDTDSSLCRREVTSSNWDKWRTVAVAAKLDFKYDGTQIRQLTVWFRKEVNSVLIEKRSLDNFTLIVYDMDSKSTGALCSSINDPHMTTFDNWYYNNFQEGFFVLYGHTVFPFEVHIVGQRCNGEATCNCAVAVRSGDTVLFVDRCRKSSLLKKLKCKLTGNDKFKCPNVMKVSLWGHRRITPGTKFLKRNNGNEYMVIFPHGGQVKIVVSGDYLNVWYTPSPADFNQTRGLCGTFDKNATNDYRLRDGTLFKSNKKAETDRGGQPFGFSENWRVKKSEDLYEGVYEEQYSPRRYCECRPGTGSSTVQSACGQNELYETCGIDTSGVELTSSQLEESDKNKNKGRRRRQSDDENVVYDDFDLDYDFTPAPIPEGDEYDSLRGEYEKQCSQHFASVAVYGLCAGAVQAEANNSLVMCVDDLVATGGETDWMDSAVEALKHSCLDELGKNENLTDNGDLKDLVTKASCPNQCNRHGNCTEGACVCEARYTGDDCSIDTEAQTTNVLLSSNACDVTQQDCSRTTVIGLGYVPGSSRCRLHSADVTDHGVVPGGSTQDAETTVESSYEVTCAIPPVLTVSAYYIEVTNSRAVDNKLGGSVNAALSSDAVEPDNSVLFIAYNATCFKCINDDNDIHCDQLNDSCVIDGRCYTAREQHPNETCRQCDPARSADKWSPSDSVHCNNQKGQETLLTVYIVIIVLCVAVILGIIAFTLYMYQRPSRMVESHDLPRASKLRPQSGSTYDTAGPASAYSDQYVILGPSSGDTA